MARSDAQRNRAKILAAARDVVRRRRASPISMAEVARRAGVGMATLYRGLLVPPGACSRRSSPTRSTRSSTAASRHDARAVAAAAVRLPPEQAPDRRRSCSTSPDDDAAVLEGGRDRVTAAAAPLVAAAQARRRDVRDDLTPEQIVALVKAIARVPGRAGVRRADPRGDARRSAPATSVTRRRTLMLTALLVPLAPTASDENRSKPVPVDLAERVPSTSSGSLNWAHTSSTARLLCSAKRLRKSQGSRWGRLAAR